MRCKPNELCVVIRDPPPENCEPLAGMLCTTVLIAPSRDFALPDGCMTSGCTTPDSWVVEFMRPVRVSLFGGGRRMASYGTVPDSALRPLRDNPGQDETLTWQPANKEVTA